MVRSTGMETNTLREIEFQVSLMCIAQPGDAPSRQIEEMQVLAASGQWPVASKNH